MNDESNGTRKYQEGLQRFSIEGINRDYIRKIKAYAALEDRSTSEIISEAISLWLEQKQKKAKL